MAESAAIDLSKLSLEELKSLDKDVAKAIRTFEGRRKDEAIAAVEAKAKELGFSLAELTGAKGAGRKSSLPPKFQHPENPAKTWSGRGRHPEWFKDAIASGKAEQDLLIS